MNPSLDFVGVPVKRVLRLFKSPKEPSHVSSSDKASDPARRLRSESDLLTFGWTLIVALWNAVSQRRATQRYLLRGRVVLCDRYTLDSAVNLRYLYGENRDYKWQERLIRFVSPKPTLSIFIDAEAAAAHARKPVKYQVEDLERYVRLYRDLQGRFGVVRINGDRSMDEVCSDVARVVWNGLYRRSA